MHGLGGFFILEVVYVAWPRTKVRKISFTVALIYLRIFNSPVVAQEPTFQEFAAGLGLRHSRYHINRRGGRVEPEWQGLPLFNARGRLKSADSKDNQNPAAWIKQSHIYGERILTVEVREKGDIARWLSKTFDHISHYQ